MKRRLRFTTLTCLLVSCMLMLLWIPSPLRSYTPPSPTLVPYWRADPSDFQVWQKRKGVHGSVVWNRDGNETVDEAGAGGGRGKRKKGNMFQKRKSGSKSSVVPLLYTHDDWPDFPTRPTFDDIKPNTSLPTTGFNPPYTIKWDYDTSAFLLRHNVQGKPPKIITWMARVAYLPSMPEPVRLRVCPEMPCLVTSARSYLPKSAALVWNAQSLKDEKQPPKRTSSDQVYILHNHERQDHTWDKQYEKTIMAPAWKSAFNWTMSFRHDADILAPYGYLVRRPSPPKKDYGAIWARKDKTAVWVVSHCNTFSRREKYVKMMQEHMSVDEYGQCGKLRCPRWRDEVCFEKVTQQYKFFLAFENAMCPDYMTEKLFRFFNADLVLVVRGGQGYERHLPPGSYINTNDFKSVKELTQYLLYLDKHPEEYIKILQTKDQYQVVYEEYPHRNSKGHVTYIHYHYEAVAFCEMCRRLWFIDSYRKTIPNIAAWFHKGDCLLPDDLN